MRFILHIGQSKSGTTSLQAFLAENRPALAAAGICYPDVERNGIPLKVQDHNPVAEELSGIHRHPHLSAEEYFTQFREQAAKAGCQTILLSGESFFGAPHIWTLSKAEDFYASHKKKLERLKALLAGDECQIIVYLRPQDDWLESAIGQVIRYEGLLGRRIYENDNQLADLLAPHLDYAAILDLWRDILNPAQLTVIPFERTALKDGDTVADFLQRLDLRSFSPSPATKTGERHHASWGRDTLTLKKILNRIPKTKTAERTIVALLNDQDRHCGNHRRLRLDHGLRFAIREKYAALNRKLADQYGVRGTSFFGETDQASPADREPLQTPDETIAALIAFETRYFTLSRFLRYTMLQLKTYLRNKMPVVHAMARRARLYLYPPSTSKKPS